MEAPRPVRLPENDPKTQLPSSPLPTFDENQRYLTGVMQMIGFTMNKSMAISVVSDLSSIMPDRFFQRLHAKASMWTYGDTGKILSLFNQDLSSIDQATADRMWSNLVNVYSVLVAYSGNPADFQLIFGPDRLEDLIRVCIRMGANPFEYGFLASNMWAFLTLRNKISERIHLIRQVTSTPASDYYSNDYDSFSRIQLYLTIYPGIYKNYTFGSAPAPRSDEDEETTDNLNRGLSFPLDYDLYCYYKRTADEINALTIDAEYKAPARDHATPFDALEMPALYPSEKLAVLRSALLNVQSVRKMSTKNWENFPMPLLASMILLRMPLVRPADPEFTARLLEAAWTRKPLDPALSKRLPASSTAVVELKKALSNKRRADSTKLTPSSRKRPSSSPVPPLLSPPPPVEGGTTTEEDQTVLNARKDFESMIVSNATTFDLKRAQQISALTVLDTSAPDDRCPFFENYDFTRVIGAGSYGLVLEYDRRTRKFDSTSNPVVGGPSHVAGRYAVSSLHNRFAVKFQLITDRNDQEMMPGSSWKEIIVLNALNQLGRVSLTNNPSACFNFPIIHDWIKCTSESVLRQIGSVTTKNAKDAIQMNAFTSRVKKYADKNPNIPVQIMLEELASGGLDSLVHQRSFYLDRRAFQSMLAQVFGTLLAVRPYVHLTHFDLKTDNVLFRTFAYTKDMGPVPPVNLSFHAHKRNVRLIVPIVDRRLYKINDFGLSFAAYLPNNASATAEIRVLPKFPSDGGKDAYYAGFHSKLEKLEGLDKPVAEDISRQVWLRKATQADNPKYDIHKLGCDIAKTLLDRLGSSAEIGTTNAALAEVPRHIWRACLLMIHDAWIADANKQRYQFVRTRLEKLSNGYGLCAFLSNSLVEELSRERIMRGEHQTVYQKIQDEIDRTCFYLEALAVIPFFPPNDLSGTEILENFLLSEVFEGFYESSSTISGDVGVFDVSAAFRYQTTFQKRE